MQEISLEKVFEESDRQSGRNRNYLNNRVELDIAMQTIQRDTLKDNDDYQLITPTDYQTGSRTNVNGTGAVGNNWGVQRSAYVSFFDFLMLYFIEVKFK